MPNRWGQARGILPASDRSTLDQHAQDWLEHVVAHTVSRKTQETYSYLLKRHVLPALGRKKLASLQPSDIQMLYSALLTKGLSAQTVHHVHACLHTCLHQALRWDRIQRNPASLVEPPKVERTEAQNLSDDELRRLLSVASGTRWEPLILLALDTGLRIGELLGLRWSDVDFERGVLRVERSLDRHGVLTSTKTEAGQRTLSINQATAELLAAHRAAQLTLRSSVGSAWEPRSQFQDLVFTTKTGRPLGYRNVLKAYHQLLKKAGVRTSGLHRLRHTNASDWLKAGEHPKVVQARLGHSNIAVTMDRYSHLIPGFDREAVDRVAARRRPRS